MGICKAPTEVMGESHGSQVDKSVLELCLAADV